MKLQKRITVIIIFIILFALFAMPVLWCMSQMAKYKMDELWHERYEALYNSKGHVFSWDDIKNNKICQEGCFKGRNSGFKDGRWMLYNRSYDESSKYKGKDRELYEKAYWYGYDDEYRSAKYYSNIGKLTSQMENLWFWLLWGFLITVMCGILSAKLFPEKKEMKEPESESQKSDTSEELDSPTYSLHDTDDEEYDDDDFEITEDDILEDYDIQCVDLDEYDYEYLSTLHPKEVIKMLGGYPRRLLKNNDDYFFNSSCSFGSSRSSSSSSISDSRNEGWYENTDYEDPADMYDDDDKF